MNDPVFSWIKRNPNKAVWGFLLLVVAGSAIGYYFPVLVPFAKWFVDNIGPIISFLIAIPIGVLIVGVFVAAIKK